MELPFCASEHLGIAPESGNQDKFVEVDVSGVVCFTCGDIELRAQVGLRDDPIGFIYREACRDLSLNVFRAFNSTALLPALNIIEIICSPSFLAFVFQFDR